MIRTVLHHASKAGSAALVLLMLASGALAADALPGAYTPEELAKVREWEKTWAGKSVTSKNIDQVAQFLTEGFVTIFKDEQSWQAPPEGFSFTITPYKPAGVTQGTIEATKKYSPTVKIDDKEEIPNYADIAGIPFPNPKSGLEVAYNFECNTRGDTYKSRWYNPVINPRTHTDRIAEQEFDEMFWYHRVDVEPVPALAAKDNPKGYMRTQFMHMFLPPEMLNSRLLQIRYLDDKKDDDAYLYYKQFRRIRRISATERTNAIDGTDQLYDDGYQWDSHITLNTYKLIGKKELLCPRHTRTDKVTRVMGQGYPNGLNFERCNTWVVEAVSKTKGYLYSKRVWYVDPETYLIIWQDVWDRNGKYWKTFCEITDDVKTVKGETRNFFTALMYWDLIRIHAAWSDQKPLEVSTPTIKPDLFTTNNLQQTY